MAVSRYSSVHQTCQFFLGDDGTVLSCDSHAPKSLGLPGRRFVGRSLQAILTAINPDWEEMLAQPLKALPSPLQLDWQQVNGVGVCHGIRLHLLRAQQNWVATLIPTSTAASETSILKAPSTDQAAAPPSVAANGAETDPLEYVEMLAAAIPGVVFEQERDFSFTALGIGLEELLGLDAALLERNPRLFLELMLEADRSRFERHLMAPQKPDQVIRESVRLRHPSDGHIMHLLDIRQSIADESGNIYAWRGIWIDVTRQKVAEERLTRSAWKENLAVLTSGLVHDFSNVVAGIFSLSELYHADLEEDHPWYKGMGQIKSNAQAARALVRRIIDLNRENASDPTYHNLEKLVEDQFDLLRVILPKGTSLRLELTGEELPVYLDDVSFRQMLLNFGINSRDALGLQPQVILKLRVVERNGTILKGTVAEQQARTSGVELVFSDNGSGIPKSHLERIFEPFFTTKEVSKGTGFGLYNARLFVESCGGALAARSAPGKGTDMMVFLPLADFSEEAMYAPEAPEPEALVERPRLKVAVYASHDPSGFQLVSQMRQLEWEVITFHKPQALKQYLAREKQPPTVLYLLYLGDDPNAAGILDYALRKHAAIQRVLQVIGVHPDGLERQLTDKADLVLDDTQRDHAVTAKLESLFT